MKSSSIKLNLLICLAAMVMLLTGSPARPQSAGFTGTVLDPTGASVAGAPVTITNEATAASRMATTEADGKYVFNQLMPGKYKVEVKAPGFKTSVRQHVDILVGITSTLDIHLEVGAIVETVIVSEQVAALNTSDASIGRPISGNELAALPTLDMNPAGLLGLQTGVAFIPSPGDHPGGYGGTSDQDGRSGAVNGARSDQSNVTLDGIDVNDPQKGFAFTSVLRTPQDALEEFRTTTTSYDADSGGRSSSAQVQLVTKSGTNNLHGSLYYAHRNEAFNANDFFLNRSGLKEPKFRHHLYGGSVGGPVIKNRVFLFGDFERLQESLFSSAERSVPSVAFKDGVFFYQCQNDPSGVNPPCTPPAGGFVQGVSGTSYGMNSKNQPCRSSSAGCGPIPQGFYALNPAQIAAIDPLGIGPNRALLSYWSAFPDPNSSGSFDGTNILGFRFGAPVNNLYNTAVVRADVHLDRADKHTIFWRGTLMHDTVNTEPQFPGQAPTQTLLNNNKGFSVGYTAVLTQRLVNNFHYGLTRISDKTGGIRNQEFVWTRFIDDLKGFVDASTEIFNRSEGRILPQHHFSDDVSWTRGVHTFSFGGEFRRTRNSTFANNNSYPLFTINPSWLQLGGQNVEPGNPLCLQTGCFAVPLDAASNSAAFHDGLTDMYGPITFDQAFYNFDKTGATQPEGQPVRRRVGVNEYELYAQDKWRLKPSFTLTAGIRWYLSSPPWETNGNQVTPTPSFHNWFNCRAQAMNAGNPTGDCGLIQTNLGGPANGRPGYYDYDYKDFSPRLAFAWAPRFKNGLFGSVFGDGKTSIRGGYSLVYDRIGNGIAASFNQYGSFGLSTEIDSFFGGCGIGFEAPGSSAGPCKRFTGINDTAAVKAPTNVCGVPPGPCLVPSPGATFPATPPSGLLTVTQGLDDKIKSPYAHTLDLSVARELKGNMTLEVAYVGRLAHRLTLLRDYAMPADLRDPKSGVRAFQAAKMLQGYAATNSKAPFQGLLNISPAAVSSYWEDLFPGIAPSGGCLVFNTFGLTTNADGSAIPNGQCLPASQASQPGLPAGYTATQVAYDYMMGYHGVAGSPGFGAVTFFQDVDYRTPPAPGVAACLNRPGNCTNTFFPAQYVNLNTWTTTGYSFYHAMQVSLRKNVSHGVSFTLNYTYSHSLDTSSTPERQNPINGAGFGGSTGIVLNAWDIRKEYSNSDFDIRHQFNGYWVAEFPFGRGKALGGNVPGWADHIIGGWQLSGIVHVNSGVPANIDNGRTWPTNWDIEGNATCAPVGAYPLGVDVGPCPGTQNAHGAVHGSGSSAAGQPTPNLFANPDQAFQHFRFTATGDRGQRNVIRADKYESLDAGLAKTFKLPREGMSFVLHWDVFNVLNSVYFDAGNLSAARDKPGTFGDYTQVLGHPRQMQLSLRFQF
jgi:hypothetical protein